MRRYIAALLLIGVLCGLVSVPVRASGELDVDLSDLLIAKQLGGEIVSLDDIPENVIVLEFDSADEAINFLNLDQQMRSEGKVLSVTQEQVDQHYNDVTRSVNVSEMPISYEVFIQGEPIEDSYSAYDGAFESDAGCSLLASSSTMNGVKKARWWVTPVSAVNVFANYTCTKGKFTKINSVTSNMSGLCLGVDWDQDTYVANIISNGKKLSTSVYGHFSYYILIKASFLRIATDNESYHVIWNL